jgi:hypothetical protein
MDVVVFLDHGSRWGKLWSGDQWRWDCEPTMEDQVMSTKVWLWYGRGVLGVFHIRVMWWVWGNPRWTWFSSLLILFLHLHPIKVPYPAGLRIEGHLIFSISPLSQTAPLSTMTSSSKLPKIPQIPEITQTWRLSYLYLGRISHTTNLPGKRSLDLELWTRVFTLDLGQGVIMIPKEVVWW